MAAFKWIAVFGFLLLQLPTGAYTFAQANDTTVLYEAFQAVSYRKPIIYFGEVNANEKVSPRLIEKFEKGKFYELSKPYAEIVDPETGEVTQLVHSVDSLILSAEEKKILTQQIRQKAIWPQNLFVHSIRTTPDSVHYHLNSVKNQNSEKSADHDASSAEKIKHAYSFTFTKPIYFREESICFVAMAAICGDDCGITEQAFFRKLNGKWVKWLVIGGGSF